MFKTGKRVKIERDNDIGIVIKVESEKHSIDIAYINGEIKKNVSLDKVSFYFSRNLAEKRVLNPKKIKIKELTSMDIGKTVVLNNYRRNTLNNNSLTKFYLREYDLGIITSFKIILNKVVVNISFPYGDLLNVKDFPLEDIFFI